MQIYELETDRLRLRQWSADDFPLFAQLNADKEVMKYFPNILSRKESDELAERCRSLIMQRGWGLWATELKASGDFIGFVGLHIPKPSLPCAPCTEVGWRLAKQYWGNGYATEAAAEALRFAFSVLDLAEVVSFTAVANQLSRAVMQRIGMIDTKINFFHPDIPENHPLSEHVLYKITQSEWQYNI